MWAGLRTVGLSWTYEIFIDPASLWVGCLVSRAFIDPSFRKQTHHRSDGRAHFGNVGAGNIRLRVRGVAAGRMGCFLNLLGLSHASFC